MSKPAYAITFELAQHTAVPAGDFFVSKVKLDGYNLTSTTGLNGARLNIDVGWDFPTTEQWQQLATVCGTRINVGVKDVRKYHHGMVNYACEVDSALLIPQTALADGTMLPQRRHIEFIVPMSQELWTPAELGKSLLALTAAKPVEIPVEPCRLEANDGYCRTHHQYHDHEWKPGDRVFVTDVANSTVTGKTHTIKYYATLVHRAKRSWEITAVDIVEGPDISLKYVEEPLLRKAKSVPQFTSIEEAEAWLEAHA